MLLVEQNARSALSIADHGVVLNLGRVVADEPRRRARRRRPAPPRLPRLLTETGDHVQQFLNTALGGLTLGHGVRRLRPGPGADLALDPDRQLRPGADGDGHDVRRPDRSSTPATPTGSASPPPCSAGLVLGAVVERVVIRPVEGKSEINAVILTLGLFIVLHAFAVGRLRQPLPLVPGAVRHPRPRGRRHHHRA